MSTSCREEESKQQLVVLRGKEQEEEGLDHLGDVEGTLVHCVYEPSTQLVNSFTSSDYSEYQ